MNTNERNWLIRTSQNQILGPVAKSKVVEFLNKGALGLNDEVSSGNGYWIHLRERDLVEKYLLGDVPQSFNPISEAQSIYSRRDNPEKTTSINASPANRNQLISNNEDNLAIPSEDDLDFPDLTLVGSIPAGLNQSKSEVSHTESLKKNELSQVEVSTESGETKIPNSEDLEYPDVASIVSNSSNTNNIAIAQSVGVSSTLKKNSPNGASDNRPVAVESDHVAMDSENIVYPANDDLEFPTLESPSAIEKSIPEKTSEDIIFELNIKEKTSDNIKPIDHNSNQNLKHNHDSTGPNLQLVANQKPEKVENSKTNHIPKDERKLLTDRKIKSPKKEDASLNLERRTAIPKPPNTAPREIAPELKKRNDSYLFIVLIVLIVFILAVFFYYYRFILNKPLPM